MFSHLAPAGPQFYSEDGISTTFGGSLTFPVEKDIVAFTVLHPARGGTNGDAVVLDNALTDEVVSANTNVPVFWQLDNLPPDEWLSHS